MPRAARKKSDASMYHVMSRSISEIDLFRCDEDKDKYLKLLKYYSDKYNCKIYAYCLMSNHMHLFINPCGFDISTFMRSLNTAYVIYYNKRYDRHGHLFQGRFASKIIENDAYALALSAYIHNNVKDLPGFENKEETYMYSSFGIYTGQRKDTFDIINKNFILRYFGNQQIIAREKYTLFVKSMRESRSTAEIAYNIKQACLENEYIDERKRNMRYKSPEALLKRLEELFNKNLPYILKAKYKHESSKIRAFTTYVMRVLCGFSYKSLCGIIGNISVSGISRLTNEGFKLLTNSPEYRDFFKALCQI